MDKFYGDYGSARDSRPAPANDAKPDARRTRMELEHMRYQFNQQAADYARMAKTVSDALDILKEAEAKQAEAEAAKSRIAAEQRAGIVKGMLLASKTNPEFVLLIDGSGSMNGRPINAALDTAASLKSAKPKVALWGDQKPAWVTDRIGVDSEMVKIKNGLNTGTDLAPVVGEVASAAALNTLDGKKTHIILLSDGDVFDTQKAKENLVKLLTTNKKTTLDVVIMGNKGTSMERFIAELETQFPARVRQQLVSLGSGNNWGYTTNTQADANLTAAVQDAVFGIVADRLRPAPRKPKAAPKP